MIEILRQHASRVCEAAADICNRWRHRLYSPPQAQRVFLWNKLDVRSELRFDYPLTRDSVVFDVGGFRGDFTAEMVARYGCHVHVFEPVTSFADQIRRRFRHNPLVKVHDVGLAGATRRQAIALIDDASSVLRKGQVTQLIALVDVAEFLEQQCIDRIDLLKLNIEGGEYELIERLLDTGLIHRVGELQVQFHEEGVPDAATRMAMIHARLAERYTLSYQVPFVWESWSSQQQLAIAA
jgi:FkbM family methyltransferase